MFLFIKSGISVISLTIMDPKETGRRYSRIASWWQAHMQGSQYGISALERAIAFTETKEKALDVGCGIPERFVSVVKNHGFKYHGVDASSEMIALARETHPELQFTVADICDYEISDSYNLIYAWDSIFHLPLSQHESVIRKLTRALAPSGILLFTFGGTDSSDECAGSFAGEEFEYSSIGVHGFIELVYNTGCSLKHLEYDQYPENHTYIIAKKNLSS